METTIAERFKILIKELKMTNNSFAISIGKTSSTINYIVDGKSKPSFDVLDAIFSTYPEINPAWLMRGQGSIRISNEKSSGQVDIIEKVEQFFSNKYEQLIEQKNNVINEQRFMLELLKSQLGKLECATETGVIKHPALVGMFLETLGQRA